MQSPIIYCFRKDLRLLDNPAFQYALDSQRPIFFIYITDNIGNDWQLGAASRWWLHYSLSALETDLAKYKAKLHYFIGNPNDIIQQLVLETSTKQVIISRSYEPQAIKQDIQLKSQLEKKSIELTIAHGNLLFKPGSILNKQGNVYRVFTPFYKACLEVGLSSKIIEKPKNLSAYKYQKNSLSLGDLTLLPKIPWDQGLKKHWKPGEKYAHLELQNFIKNHLLVYSKERDIPASDSTSHMSPYLHFGEISPQRIIYMLNQVKFENPRLADHVDSFLRQLVWREFSYNILVNYPLTIEQPFQEKFERFPWKQANKKLELAWQRGKTGYPIIDAGMRELWSTGYMHNRVRMIVASLLTKNGLLHWKKGAKWFWDTLVDADLAQNTMNWQWVAGCGVDAAPFFRIFNPITQSKKFDEDGIYIRRWCPELEKIPNKNIHAPWLAPKKILQEAGITLGIQYPEPIIDLASSRQYALDMFKSL